MISTVVRSFIFGERQIVFYEIIKSLGSFPEKRKRPKPSSSAHICILHSILHLPPPPPLVYKSVN